MKSRKESQDLAARRNSQSDELRLNGANEDAEAFKCLPDVEENDFDEAELVDDDRWDVFILDDEGEELPEYGDFWFPE